MAKTGKAPFCPWHLINDNPLISCLYCRPLGRCPICSSEATARQGEGTEGREKKREKEREGERKLAYSASQTTGQFWTKICHCLYIGCAFFAGAALFDCRWHSHLPTTECVSYQDCSCCCFLGTQLWWRKDCSVWKFSMMDTAEDKHTQALFLMHTHLDTHTHTHTEAQRLIPNSDCGEMTSVFRSQIGRASCRERV